MKLKDWVYLYYDISGPAKHFQIMWEQAYVGGGGHNMPFGWNTINAHQKQMGAW